MSHKRPAAFALFLIFTLCATMLCAQPGGGFPGGPPPGGFPGGPGGRGPRGDRQMQQTQQKSSTVKQKKNVKAGSTFKVVGSLIDSTKNEPLMYCNEVRYLDLGHNCITNIDFVRNMPNLEVAVLSVSWLESLEPLSSCEKLIYLECFSTNITDLSPLASCISLKYLNIGSPRAARPFTDLSPLYELDLKRLYCTSSPIPKDQQEQFMSLHPDCECEFGMVDPSKGYWRFIDGNPANTDPSNRNEVYAWLFEVFGYDDLSNQSK